jgi:hypothetical protein
MNKVKLTLSLIKQCAIKTCGEWRYSSIILCDRCACSASLPGHFTPWKTGPLSHCIGLRVGPKARSGRHGWENPDSPAPSPLLHRLSVIKNWRGFGWKRLHCNLRYYLGICLEGAKKAMETKVGIYSDPAEIRTCHLTNKSLKPT